MSFKLVYVYVVIIDDCCTITVSYYRSKCRVLVFL